MKKHGFFPGVHVDSDLTGGVFDAAIGFKLASIVQAHLLLSNYEQGEGLRNQSKSSDLKHRAQIREAFLHALSGLSSDVFLELRIVAFPSIASWVTGRLSIHILIRAVDSDKEAACEKVLSAFLSLHPLLRSHFSEAEFTPVMEQDELQHLLLPFVPTHASSVCRTKKSIALSRPMKRLSIGFGSHCPIEIVEDHLVIDHIYSWRPSHDDWHLLLHTLVGQMDPTELIVRLKPSEPEDALLNRLRKNLETCEDFLGGLSEKEGLLRPQAQMIRDVSLERLSRLDDVCFDLGVFVLSKRPVDPVLTNVVGRSVTRSGADGSDCNFFEGGFQVQPCPPKFARSCELGMEERAFTLSEAACAFRLPDPPREGIPGLSIRRSRTNPAFLELRKGGLSGATLLFNNVHQGIEQQIFSTMEDRFRHMFIIGQTGAGKSTLMESLILQDIRDGRGVAVIDPHGELVAPILGKIPKGREKDVIYFDMLDRKRPLGFNVIQWQTIEERDLIIDELYLTLDRIYDMQQAGGPMFENNMRGILKLLMGGKKEKGYVPTLLEFTQCYQEEDFRNWLRERACDPQLTDFLNELEKTRGEAGISNISPYITSKFSRFVHDATLRLIIGQEKTGFDFEEILNQKKILLVNLGKGRFGPNASALLANQLVSRFKNAAMKRGDMKPGEREPFFFICGRMPQSSTGKLQRTAFRGPKIQNGPCPQHPIYGPDQK